MEHDQREADRSECYCESCTDRAVWHSLDA
jgi:hypothetical protein